jgi:hypothetical protein
MQTLKMTSLELISSTMFLIEKGGKHVPLCFENLQPVATASVTGRLIMRHSTGSRYRCGML